MKKYRRVTLGSILMIIPLTLIFPQTQTRIDAALEFRNGNFERAIDICREEINANPKNLEAYVIICRSLMQLARYQEAFEFARLARLVSRYDLRIISILGEISYHEGRNYEALQYFQEYINLAPDGMRTETAYYYLGEIFIRLGRFRHADIALSTAVHWLPNNANWWTRLAFARESAGDLREAILAYERALTLNPQLADARRGLNRVRQRL